jgi:hypothetical protein
MKIATLAFIGLSPFAQAFEVHEWGTFTVLAASSGIQTQWYAGIDEIATLPEFVGKAMVGKSGFQRVRMETPVLYFYPEKEEKVSVRVTFENGDITETFPIASVFRIEPGFSGASWSGTLLPPTDPKALALIPKVDETNTLEPYAAAREVPGAWVFRSDPTDDPIHGRNPDSKFPQAEKFIFYRGSGNSHLSNRAVSTGETITTSNFHTSAMPFGTALRVSGGTAEWVQIPSIPGLSRESKESSFVTKFTGAVRPVDEVENELAAVWKTQLAKQGLTPDEASAMVETWRKTWFRESGDRVLCLVPQEEINALLPLEITPMPKKITRVFVARLELISRETEHKLVGLLTSETSSADEFHALDLGRFGYGAATIASELEKNRMLSRFGTLRGLSKLRETSRK